MAARALPTLDEILEKPEIVLRLKPSERYALWIKALAVLNIFERPDATSLEEQTTTPEDTLREAGISSKRQARYQRRMSKLLARRS